MSAAVLFGSLYDTAARATSWIAIPTDLKIAIPPVGARTDGAARHNVGQVDGLRQSKTLFQRRRQSRPPLPAGSRAVADHDIGAANRV